MHWKRMICLCLSALLLLGLFPPVLAAEETGAEAEPVPVAEAIGAEAEPVPAAEAIETETEPPTPEEQLLEMLDREQTEAPAAQTPDEEIVSLPEIGIEHFRLGCASEMMLAGGGRMVSAPEGLYFLAEADDSIWLTGGEGARCILAEPAACLNYIDGKLIYAAPAEDSFSVWRLDPASGERACLLDAFPGRPSQLYAADDGRIWFLAGDAIWRAVPENAPERLCGADDLVSFVPTGYGMVYARGTLFDLTLWLNGVVLAENVQDYYVISEENDERIICSIGGADVQLSLAALFAGEDYRTEFAGLDEPEPMELPEEAVPALPEAEYVSVEPEGLQTRAARPVENTTAATASQGQINIALRAYQMTDIKWKCVKNVYGWRSGVLYQAGVTYTGLPYGQPTDKYYVPWNCSLSRFLTLTGSSSSGFYTERSSVVDGLAYAVDCSAFVSWAWQTNTRMDTTNLAKSSVSTLVSSTSYANAQIGDCLNNITNHVVLITNIRYSSSGTITAIETASATVNANRSYCCTREWYGSGYSYSLADLQSRYFGSGYKLYRCNNRNAVTFTPEPSIPVSHDGSAAPTSTKPVLHYGIDVSQWQGTINWAQAAKNIEFAIIRSNSGSDYYDTNWELNVSGCTRYNVPYGVYVYAKATSTSAAIAEARLAISRLRGRRPNLPIFYDVEDNATILKLSDAQLYQVVAAFCNTIEDAGFRAGIYCSTNFWNSRLYDVRYAKWTRWVAQWNTTCTYQGGMNLWQYSNVGRIPGIVDSDGKYIDVDLNVWFGEVGNESHMYTMSRTEPTCTKRGSIDYESTDGQVKWSQAIEALGHNFKNGKCTRCNAVLTTAADYFIDVSKTAWYYKAVAFVVEKGLFNGMSAIRFNPNGEMTRGMLVTVLWRMAGKPAAGKTSPFVDVPAGKYYTTPVLWAYNAGLVNGMDATHFDPNRSITREQLATIFYRYAGEPAITEPVPAEPVGGGIPVEDPGFETELLPPALDPFEDAASVSKYARTAMAWAVEAGLITGMTPTQLNPKGLATRAQVAMIVMRYMEKFGK